MFYSIAKAAEASDSGESSIVTCSGLDCSVCELVKTIVNIFNWLTWVSAAVAILVIVIGGFIYIGARGNEMLMSQAKRTIIWAVTGFALVLLAFMAIKATYQVVGATNQGFWEEIDCGSESAQNSNRLVIPEQTAAGLLRGAKNGGIIAGRLKSDTSSSDLTGLIENLSEEDVLIFSAASKIDRNPIMAIGKKDDQPELLFVNRALLNELLRSKVSFKFLKVVKAQTNDSEKINELLAEITQVVQRLIEKKQDLLVIIAKRAGLNLDDKLGESISVSTVYNITNKVSQCFDSGGYWYLFKDICQAARQSCKTVKCTPQENFSLIASCQCEEGKCLSGSRCVNK